MVELKFSGKCCDCLRATLTLDYIDLGTISEPKRVWTVNCIHSDACNRVESITTEKMKQYIGEAEVIF